RVRRGVRHPRGLRGPAARSRLPRTTRPPDHQGPSPCAPPASGATPPRARGLTFVAPDRACAPPEVLGRAWRPVRRGGARRPGAERPPERRHRAAAHALRGPLRGAPPRGAAGAARVLGPRAGRLVVCLRRAPRGPRAGRGPPPARGRDPAAVAP